MVHKKLLKIMNDFGYIQKDAKISTNRGSFTVVSEAAILNEFRPRMIQEKLILVPTGVRDLSRAAPNDKGNAITTAIFQFTFIDTEDDDRLVLEAPGQGADPMDKAAGMAYTYAYKNVIRKALMIVAGDDPDTKQGPEEAVEYTNDQVAVLARGAALLKAGKLTTQEFEYLKSNIIAVFADPAKLERMNNFLKDKEEA